MACLKIPKMFLICHKNNSLFKIFYNFCLIGFYRLCNEHGISAYPTSIFFNGSIRHIFSGNHNGEAIADFVTDILRPSVTVLNKVNLLKNINDRFVT